MSFFKKLFSKSAPEKSPGAEVQAEKRTAPAHTNKPPVVARRQPLPLGTKAKEEKIPAAQDLQERSISSLLDASEAPTPSQSPETTFPNSDVLPALETPEALAPEPETPLSSTSKAMEAVQPANVMLSPKDALAFTAKQKALKDAKALLNLEDDTTQIQTELLIRRWHKRFNWLQDNGTPEQRQLAKQKLHAIALVKSSIVID